MRVHHKNGVRLFAAVLVLLGVVLAGCGKHGASLASKDRAVSSLLQISMRPDSVLTSGGAWNSLDEFNVYKHTQAQLIKSPLVLIAALRKPEIASLPICKRGETVPVSWLQENLEVSFPADSEIMKVSLADRNTEEAAKVVNAVVDAYLSEIVGTERNQKTRELATIEEVLAAKEREVRQKRSMLKRSADELGTSDRETLNVQLQFASQQLSAYRQELLRAQTDLRKAKAERRVLQAALERIEKQNASKTPAESTAGAQPELRRVAEEMSALVNQLGQVVATLSDAQLSQRLQEDLVTIQQRVAAWQGLLGTQLLSFRSAELKEKIQDVDVRIALATEEVAELQKEVATQQEEFGKIGQSSVDVEMMRADLTNLEKVVSDFATKRQRLEVELKSQPRVRLLQRAEPRP